MCTHDKIFTLLRSIKYTYLRENDPPPPPPPKKWIFNCLSCISNVIRERNDFPVKLNISVFLFFFLRTSFVLIGVLRHTGRFGLDLTLVIKKI